MRWRRPRHLALAGLAATLIAPLVAATRPGATPPLFSVGLLGNDLVLAPIPPGEVKGAAYVPGSNVLRLADGRFRYLPLGATEPITVAPPVAHDPTTGGASGGLDLATGGLGPDGGWLGDPGVEAAVAADRAWLAAGAVPGAGARQRAAAARSLLDLRLLLRPGGAVLAAQTPYWAYVWPRDASFVAAAFAVTGHGREAVEILEFLGRAQRPDETWPARLRPDGRPVTDSRRAQLDATGWVPWAAWLASDQGRDLSAARRLWRMVWAAATAAERSLGRDGLPLAGSDYSDYWERPERRPTLGTAAALRTGLRAAGDLAAALAHHAEAARYRHAASRLDKAIGRAFWGLAGFHRYPVQLGGAPPGGDGPDAAVTWLGPPFAPASRMVREGVARAAAQLAPGGGGAVPGLPWRAAGYWTPATASFALAAMASGDRAGAERRLGWLLDHRTALGVFPERVRRGDGQPRSVAPLAWTDAIVLLTLSSGDRPLPIPGT